jgi:tetratricopeptide (TPR) repeat protein
MTSRAAHRPLRRAATTALVVACLVAGLAGASSPLDTAKLDELGRQYALDPALHGDALLGLAGNRVAEVPPQMRLIVADAALRAGKGALAQAYLLGALEADLGEPWNGWSRLALGWLALSQRDLDEARLWFDRAAAEPSPTQQAGRLGLALVTASRQDGGATGLFDEVLRGTPPNDALHDAAALGAAYGRYWSGDVAGARAAFDELAKRAPNGRFSDDARYASAWMDVHLGDTERATAALRELAGPHEVTEDSRVRTPILNLESRALVREGTRRYQQSRLAPPEQQLANVLDGDGGRMARAALLVLESPDATAAAMRAPVAQDRDDEPEDAILLAEEDVPGDTTPPPAPLDAPRPQAGSEPSGGGWLMWLAGLALAAIVVLVLRRRGRRA